MANTSCKYKTKKSSTVIKNYRTRGWVEGHNRATAFDCHWKLIRLTFQEDGGWNSHVEGMIEKSTFRLQNLKFCLAIYKLFILALLDLYLNTLGQRSALFEKRLENIQIEAARIVTGATKLCSKSKLYDDTGWESLLDRRKKTQNKKNFMKCFIAVLPNI